MSGELLPGATIGVLGGGQLGRMFAFAARRMGYRVHIFSPDAESPAGQVADFHTRAEFSDFDRLRVFAQEVDLATFEFENIPVDAAYTVGEYVPVRPSGDVLYKSQHRLREKRFLRGAGIPVVPFAAVHSPEELTAALAELGTPAVLKTAGWGYDGKGQVLIRSLAQAPAAWQEVATREAVVEAFVDFQAEISVVAARGLDGRVVHYPAFDNTHANHVLDVSVAPADVPASVQQEAFRIAREVLEALDVVGVLCVEFFLATDGRLMVNELAPRPHNSGHLTIDACVTSQYEQQLRAICGFELGSTELVRPAAMANLLGDLWQAGEPNWAAALARGDVKLHLYGKQQPRPGRKMGHLTALGGSRREALECVLAAREALAQRETAMQPLAEGRP